ncbi:MAG: esterase family protein [Actinomycetales bacterium]|nr:esterase family protein [Actinomycetales bacterium]
MAHLRCDFFSEALGLSTSMTVVLPQRTTQQIGMAGAAGDAPPPVLYLLHGLSDDDTIWLRRTSIERYVAELGLAVVMPQVHRSFYLDGVYTGAYWTFVAEELPALVAGFFRVSRAREDTFVAGLSMGGYGAMLHALRQPERFAAAASLSGALDVGAWAEAGDPHGLLRTVAGGHSLAGTDADLLTLLDAADVAALPPLYVRCGTEDELVDANRRFVARAQAVGADVTSGFDPGTHEWGYWDRTIRDVLDWLPISPR